MRDMTGSPMLSHGTPGGVGGGDVETLHAEIGRALGRAGTSLPVSTRINCLAPPAGYSVGTAIHFEMSRPAVHRSLSARRRFRLVVFDADQHALAAEQVAEDATPRMTSSARSRISRSSQVMNGSHSAPLMTSSSIGTVFDAVSLPCVGKYRTAKADDAGFAQALAHGFLRFHGCRVVDRLVRAIHSSLPSASISTDRVGVSPDGCAATCSAHDGEPRARGRGMHGRGDPAIGFADQLALEYVVARADQRSRCAAD
jgi:hypothetical protein